MRCTFHHFILALISLALLTLSVHAASTPASDPSTADPFLWLEDITGQKALAWVHAQNALTTDALEKSPEFGVLRKQFLEIVNSKARIPEVTKQGKYLYNFWQDEHHVRGLWRRTTMDEYKNANPAWEPVLDLDRLAATEKENWVWHEQVMLEPSYDRCLILLSRGGADAHVMREFDLVHKTFVDGGFTLPEAKLEVTWRNRDDLYVATDFGPGSLTASGYPRIIKEWKRGTPLSSAKTVFEGQPGDISVSPYVEHDHGRVYEFISRGLTFFSDETFVRRGDKWTKIDKPADAEVQTFADYMLLRLRSDWTVAGKTYPSGTLLAENFDDYLRGGRKFAELFTPTARTSLSSISATKDFVVLNELENVVGRPYLLRPGKTGWAKTPLDALKLGSVSVEGVDANQDNEYFMTVEGFLTPPTLFLGTTSSRLRLQLKSLPEFFDPAGLEVQQFEATSKDGTKIPYFQVGRKNMKLDGSNPTILTGYGGFEIPMVPEYQAGRGVAMLERGGVSVVANIRGGGEFGPSWHGAAQKEHRQRGYDDFIAVAEDLIARKVTSPRHLGIEGGSNGGLLMGVMLTERPDLFHAVVCESPLLDMRRYNKLLAGASWVDEYGNPDKPADWAYLSKYSPYQNVRDDIKYPRVLFMTSTRDDRVHPGHARKMAALMESKGDDVLFYENTEGGHEGAANNDEIATVRSLVYTFFIKELF